jgi:hypothetical protein
VRDDYSTNSEADAGRFERFHLSDDDGYDPAAPTWDEAEVDAVVDERITARHRDPWAGAA